jgi:hypothetical protein
MDDELWSLKSAMRRLWTDHVLWTRDYVVAATGGAPMSERLTAVLGEQMVGAIATPLGSVVSVLGEGDAAAVRLLKNQEHLGQAIVPFYGDDAGRGLTGLLKQHIMIAVDLVAAARAGDHEKFQVKDVAWSRNAEEIAGFLSGANHRLTRNDLVDLLGQHLSLTKQEVTARLQQNWSGDVDAFDQIFTEILTVADVLADGIARQFPERLPSRNGRAAKAQSLSLALRRLWSDHVIWTRQYIVAAAAERADAKPAASRLLKNQEDIGNAVVPFYGPQAGQRLTELLKQHITIAVEIIDAARKGEDARYEDANARWDHNVEEIAELLSSANPNWRRADLVDLLMQHLNLTRNEVRAHLQKRWEADVDAFDQILTEILTVSDALCDGIVKQFPAKFSA